MTDIAALWVAALLACAATAGQAQAQAPAQPAPAAATTDSAKDSAKATVKDSAPARSADPEPPRRLKFKGRAANCLCADPITDEEIDAAAARQDEGKTKTPTPRSKP